MKALRPLYRAYFEAQDALASDNLDAGKAAIKRLDEVLGKVEEKQVPLAGRKDWAASKTRMAKAAKKGMVSRDLKDARTAFRDLSVDVIAVEKQFGHQGSAVHFEVFCSMAFGKGASWLQTSDKIRNPYYGASMLTCGSVKHRHPGKETR